MRNAYDKTKQINEVWKIASEILKVSQMSAIKYTQIKSLVKVEFEAAGKW